MHTVRARTAIGFPADRQEWTGAPAVFTPHALRIAGHPVMEDWEAGYMRELAAIACGNGGHVLEVGYGLGLSARAIQACGVQLHTVIECHPDVVARALANMRGSIDEGAFRLLKGFWQDLVPGLPAASFDGILFDTYPLAKHELHRNHFPFFAEAHRLLKPGGVLTYYSDEASDFSPDHRAALLAAGFDPAGIDGRVCPVDPPADCQYWREPTLLAPIIRKRP